MKIQVNTDRNVEGGEALTEMVEAEVNSALANFADRLTRVEVHLGDEDGAKKGVNDKRCTMEARPANMKPVAVTAHDDTLEQACREAARKMASLLESTFGKADRRD